MDTMTRPSLILTPFGSLDRRLILGASEVSCVLGMSRYYTPLAIYLAKHRTDAQMIDRGAAQGPARWGNRLEHAIRSAYEEDILAGTGLVVARGDDQIGTVTRADTPWMAASPDGIVHGPDSLPHEVEGWQWGLEVKNVDRSQGWRWGDTGTDQVPDEYALQCHWAMLVTGLDRWDVAALIGGNDFRVYTLRRDDELLASLTEQMTRFWHDHVLAGNPPEPMAPDNEILGRLLKQSSTDVVEGDATVDQLAVQLGAAKANAAAATEAVDLLEAQLKVAIGDRAGARGPWGKITFAQNKPTTVTNWQAVAQAVGAPPEVISQHTTERAGARPFRVTLTGGTR